MRIAGIRVGLGVAVVVGGACGGQHSTNAPEDGGLTSSPAVDGGLDDRAISDGLAVKTGGSVGSCTPTEDRYVDGDFGIATARDGRTFAVPGPIEPGVACTDLYNPCNGGTNPGYASQLSTIVIDEGPAAVDVTGFIYGDNYFELYVNGRYVCRDALTFVPFNSHVVRFRATYPMTIAIKAIDWEQDLGVGVETKNGAKHVGDGGLAARFVDATGRAVVTSADWKCQPYYVAPVDDPDCVAADRDSSRCPSASCVSADVARCQAVHWPIPSDWASSSFEDSGWPSAVAHTAAEVGPKTAYTANASLFMGANFIWSKNLALDNLVLCRRVVAP